LLQTALARASTRPKLAGAGGAQTLNTHPATPEGALTMETARTCPFDKDCKLVADSDFEQSGERQFFRDVTCETHKRTFSETLRVAGYFEQDSDGMEGRFLLASSPLPQVEEL
jgi:hypothetical protein